jgi:cytochrome P450
VTEQDARPQPVDERFVSLADEIDDEPMGFSNEVVTGPVSDFASDFDHTADQWAADPYPIIEDLRERCPIAHTDRYGGGWLPVHHDEVAEIAYDTEHFTSRSVVMGNHRPPLELAPVGIAPPISSDPPFHHGARRVLLPAFAPGAIAKLEPDTRAYCESLLDDLESRQVVDAAADFAQHIPVRVIADMLGFPPEDAELFRGFVHNTLEGINEPLEVRFERMQGLFGYLSAQIEDHLRTPRDDLTSFLIDAEMDGVKLDAGHIVGSMALLLLAGIDTTWSAIGASIWHLAKTPADRERLVAEPDLLPVAMEELLRAYSPVTMARLVKDDMDWHGCPMKAEDWVLLSFPAANRDPAVFEHADRVVIDREINRHSAFGLGVHRCLGSHLARMELRVALETWLARFPSFSLLDPDAVTWSPGQVRGPRQLPIAIG